MGQRAVRCLVDGRVQGVFFRASTAKRARSLGLTGYAKNLEDGRVEVVVSGPEEEIAALCQWLWKGSPASRVTAVAVEDWGGDLPDEGFSTR